MDEEIDLWELVRQKIGVESEEEINEDVNNPENQIEKNTLVEALEVEKKPGKRKLEEDIIEQKENDFTVLELLNEGIMAGFIYMSIIMIFLGILAIPGSINAAIGGFFGGKKAGNPTKALTAAMLPFLIISMIFILSFHGALPPGSGPNDVATIIGKSIGYEPSKNLLGPISMMPNSDSSVFVSVVVFAFIGGLVQDEKKRRNMGTSL